jgi:signal transduction histidine kinase
MNDADDDRRRMRVLVLAPGGKDASLTCTVLDNAGIACETVPDVPALVRELHEGAGALLVTEESIGGAYGNMLAIEMVRQPPWSDLPILVMTHQGADSPVTVQALQSLGNVTLLERPTRVSALVSAVRSALRARHRQHQTRLYLQERERTAAALRDADRRKDEFLATLAHELRNPLAPIRTGLHLLHISQPGSEPASQARAMMERQLSHLIRLVDDLLEVSRISTGKIELRRERLELAAAVLSAVETVRPLMEAAHHRLDISLPPEPVMLEGDFVRLAQVVANLLSNAAKYTDPGGRVALTMRREQDQAVVSVRDSGVGIAPEQLPQLFDMFAQAEGTRYRAQGGLGIGLALARRLTELHGGRVEARSEGAGKGSEFRVYLPLA